MVNLKYFVLIINHLLNNDLINSISLKMHVYLVNKWVHIHEFYWNYHIIQLLLKLNLITN